MGLKSFSIETRECTLGTSTTYADFHCGGKIPSRNKLFKIAVSGAATTSALLCINHARMSSGPVTLFTFTLVSASSVVATLMIYWSGNSSILAKTRSSLRIRDKCELTDTNNNINNTTYLFQASSLYTAGGCA